MHKSSMNKAILVGNLGADPDVSTTQSGLQIAKFNLATTEMIKSQSGEATEATEWHKCIAFGTLADIVAKYATKGRKAYVEGRIKTNKWTDKDGVERYSTGIIIDTFILVDRKPVDEFDGGYEKPSTKQNDVEIHSPEASETLPGFEDLPF